MKRIQVVLTGKIFLQVHLLSYLNITIGGCKYYAEIKKIAVGKTCKLETAD